MAYRDSFRDFQASANSAVIRSRAAADHLIDDSKHFKDKNDVALFYYTVDNTVNGVRRDQGGLSESSAVHPGCRPRLS